MRHPADEQYQHTFGMHTTTPGNHQVLLPRYRFNDALEFPHRNALSSPVPAVPPLNHRYQHPAQLDRGHMHPFVTSPPPLGSPGLDDSMDDTGFRYHGVKEGHWSSQNDSWLGVGEAIPMQQFVPTTPDKSNHDAGVVGVIPSCGKLTTATSKRIETAKARTSINAKNRSPRVLQDDNDQEPPVTPTLPPVNTEWGSHRIPGSTLRRSNGFYESLNLHRLRLQEEGLLPDIAVPPTRSPVSPLTPLALSPPRQPVAAHTRSPRYSGVNQYRASYNTDSIVAHHMDDNGTGDHAGGIVATQMMYQDAFEEPISYNMTPILPRALSHQISQAEFQLLRPRRANSSIATLTRGRKKAISRIILALCVLFPPFLLLYGYSCLDPLIFSITNGQIEHFGRLEKKFGRYMGWLLTASVVFGLAIGLTLHFK
jgi:hypothetical protein